jgi:hypothetical protein
MKPISKVSAGAETPGSFAALYASKYPVFSAPENPWIKLDFGRPATHFWSTELTCRPDGTTQLLTPALVRAKTQGSLLLHTIHLILEFQPRKSIGSKVALGRPAPQF